MKEFRDYIEDYLWAFPLLGGILTFIAILTPASFLFEGGVSIFIWMWGLASINISNYYETINLVIFTDNPLILIPSIIISVVILLNIIILFLSSYFYRRDRNKGKVVNSRGLIASIFIIISTILWMISMEITFFTGSGISFWFNNNVGFGVLGVFLGAGLGIMGYGFSKYIRREKENEIFLPKTTSPMRTTSSTNIPSKFNFCPECGQKIIAGTQRFCVNCGFELTNI